MTRLLINARVQIVNSHLSIVNNQNGGTVYKPEILLDEKVVNLI
jgi:hypothetical protein